MIHEKLPSKALQQLKRTSDLKKINLPETQIQIYQLHLHADEIIDIFNSLQAFILRKYTQERDRQYRQQIEIQQQLERFHQQHVINKKEEIAKKMNLEGRRGYIFVEI